MRFARPLFVRLLCLLFVAPVFAPLLPLLATQGTQPASAETPPIPRQSTRPSEAKPPQPGGTYRRALANDGMFLVVVTVDKQTGALIGRPEIVTRGFIAGEDDPLIAAAVERVRDAIHTRGEHTGEIALLKTQIKDGLSRFLYEQTKRRPMVFPVVVLV